MTIVFRDYGAADFDAFVEAQSLAFSRLAIGAYTETEIRAVEKARRTAERAREMLEIHELCAVTPDGRVVGGAGHSRQADRPACARIRRVFVHPDFAGKGVGTRLVREVEARAVQAGFERFVVCSSLNAVPFYEKLGYRALGLERRAYGSIVVSFVFMGKG